MHALSAYAKAKWEIDLQWLTLARYGGGLVFSFALGGIGSKGGLGFCRTRHPLLQIARSALLAVVTITAFIGATRLPLPMVTALTFAWPALATIADWLLQTERPTRAKALSVAICSIGVTALASSGGSADAIGVCAMLLGAAGNAAQVVLNRKLAVAGESAATSTFYMGVVGAGAALVWWVVAPSGAPTLTLEGGLVLLAIPAISVVGQTLYALAQERCTTAQLAPLTYLFQLPFSAAVGIYVLGQPLPSPTRLAAMAVIVVGALIAYWPKRLAA